MVKKDYIEACIPYLVQALLPARSSGYKDPGAFEQTLDDVKIHGIVIHHEHIRVRRDKLRDIRSGLTAVFVLDKYAHGCIINDLLIKGKDELRALAVFALTDESPSHELCKSAGDVKSKTCPLYPAVFLLIQTLIRSEELFHVLLLHAYARITHGESEPAPFIHPLLHGYAKGKASRIGIFHGICQQVQYYLLYLPLITVQASGQKLVYDYIKGQLLFGAPHPYH